MTFKDLLGHGKRGLRWFAWLGAGLLLGYLLLLPVRYQRYRSGPVSVTAEPGKLAAYADRQAYATGDTVRIAVHATGDYSATVYRYAPVRKVVHRFVGTELRANREYSTRYGHDWTAQHRLATASWPSGYYFVNFRLRADTSVQYNLPLLLRARETPARLVLVAPTNTWQAYNTYGGRSNYVDRVTPVDLRYLFLLFRRSAPGLAPYTYLPRRRPFSHPVNRAAFRDDWAGLEGKISADLSLVNFLEERRIPYDVISDETFARYEGLDSATLVLFSNHSEYWSYAGMGVLRQLMDRGVSVLFLSGNNMYRGVEWLKGETMLVTEPVKDRAPVERLLGTFYTEAGYGEAWSPYRVVDTAHWSMLGTGLRPGDTFGGPSASGIETDKMGPFAEGFRLLAVGDNAAGGAHLVLKDFPAGNFLCNTSSIASWRGVRDDPAFRRFVLNLFVRSGVLTDPL